MLAINEFLFNWLFKISSSESLSRLTSTTICGIIIIGLAYLFFYIAKNFLVSFAHKLAKRTKTEWDDILVKNNVFSWLAHIIPAAIIYFSSGFAQTYYPDLQNIVRNLGELYFLIIIVSVFNAFFLSVNEIYDKSVSFAKERPITGFIQLVQILLYIVGIMIFVTIVFDKELSKLITGLGAMTAILLFIFKDIILGFVASIQISMNNMVKIGDWIVMPTRGADGDVIEITLTTVKVQNWDKTISNLPTYALISEHFVNWKGMSESGGRRIKRSINIDMNSVKFCTEDMIKDFNKISLIKNYLKEKEIEILEFNAKEKDQFRQQTNLGIFRKYIETYLHKNETINGEMTFLVRHLQPTPNGIPIEIYVFCKDKVWANYEVIQADIFDHILAIIPKFNLSVFQNPTGSDFIKLKNQL